MTNRKRHMSGDGDDVVDTLAQNEFQPHPAGIHSGTITSVIDEGMRQSAYGGKTHDVHNISINVESGSAANKERAT